MRNDDAKFYATAVAPRSGRREKMRCEDLLEAACAVDSLRTFWPGCAPQVWSVLDGGRAHGGR